MKIADIEILRLAEFRVTNWLVANVIFRQPPGPPNCWVTLSEKPGLGLEINEDSVKEYRVQ